MKKRALITGIAGQDGSYLAEHLLELEYLVYGIVRQRTTEHGLKNIKHLTSFIELIDGDITDASSTMKIVRTVKPHEVYNLAAQSHVGASFKNPEMTLNSTGKGALNLLEAIHQSDFRSSFYQASTSELFGNSNDVMQSETTPFSPVSPYGCAKLYAHHMTTVYRESYNMFACAGILFNHESPRRGPDFVTQKIATAVAAYAAGNSKKLKLGNVNAHRDWGHAADYVRAMHLMLQQNRPNDFVIATGQTHSIQEFIDIAVKHAGVNKDGFIEIDPTLYRPTDVNVLRGDASRAMTQLGWEPKISFNELVVEMVDSARKSVS